MEWNVYYHDFNRNEIITFNIFRHYRFTEDVKKLIKDTMIDKAKFTERLRSELMYNFWSKCEYEVVIVPFVGRDRKETGIKIDIYEQVMLNWDRFVDYVWSFRKGE